MKDKIEAYVKEIQEAYHNSDFWCPDGKHQDKHTFSVEYGRKFAKIIHTSWGSGSVHCFVEIANGNIHKAATYKAPQKNGLRGNILDAKKPLFSGDYYVYQS